MEDWWTTLEERYDYPDPDLPDGRAMVVNIFAAALMQGTTRVVKQDELVLSQPGGAESDDEVTDFVQEGLTYGTNFVNWSFNQIFMANHNNENGVLKYLGNLKNDISTAYTNPKALFGNTFGEHIQSTALLKAPNTTTSAVTTTVVTYVQGDTASETVKTLASIGKNLYVGITKVQTLVRASQEISGWITALRAVNAPISTVFAARSEVVGCSRTAGAIGAVIAGVIAWGFFIYGVTSNNVPFFSPTFNGGLALTIAATIYLILTAILAATVIGTLIVAIVALLDAFLSVICELGVDALKNLPGMNGACFTLGGAITNYIAFAIYNFAPMVSMDDEHMKRMLVMGAPELSLSYPEKGYVAGQEVSVSMPLTATVCHQDPLAKYGLLIYPYGWIFYSADNLRSTTVKATLTAAEAKFDVDHGQMNAQWSVTEDHKWGLIPMYRAQASDELSKAPTLLQAGINREVKAYLNMAYAVPAYECWGLLVTGVCYVRSLNGNASQPDELVRVRRVPRHPR